MVNKTGINIILADSHDAIESLKKVLGVEQVYLLSDLPDPTVSLDAVFTMTDPDEGRLRHMAKMFNVQRGVLSINGKHEFLGFNVDWMSRLIVVRDLDNAVEPVTPTPEVLLRGIAQVITGCYEKDDPFESLGYRR